MKFSSLIPHSSSLQTLAATLVILLVEVGQTHAQQVGPYPAGPYARPGYNPVSGPQLSPYLNLLRGGNPAANYFSGVLPEIDRRLNSQVFSAEIQDLERRLIVTPQQPVDELIAGALPGTGHPVQFLNDSPYYNRTGVYRPGSAPLAGGRQRSR
jgi:hypothetical protein